MPNPYDKSALLRENLSVDDKHIKGVMDEFLQNGVVMVVTKAKKRNSFIFIIKCNLLENIILK